VSNIESKPHLSAEIIAEVFSAPVTGLILPIDDYVTELSPQEFKFIHRASNKRKFEFSTGRWCAKQLLSKHGIIDTAILSGENREPIWPDNFVGSISHCKDQCGAVIADKSVIKSIGFDVETKRKLKHNIARVVCTDLEKDWLNKQEPQLFDDLVLLLFSLKESIYKCVFQHQKVKLGFKGCSVQLNYVDNTAHVSFNNEMIDGKIKLKLYSTNTHVYTSAIYLNY